jgi:hypothetical protein
MATAQFVRSVSHNATSHGAGWRKRAAFYEKEIHRRRQHLVLNVYLTQGVYLGFVTDLCREGDVQAIQPARSLKDALADTERLALGRGGHCSGKHARN